MTTGWRAAAWLLAAVAPLVAQHRLPFTGVVRDAAGAPIGGDGPADPFAAMISDRDGRIVARVPRSAAGHCNVVATWRGKASAAGKLPGDSRESVVLELPR